MGEPESILLVQGFTKDALEPILEQAGLSVVRARNGKQAVEQVQKRVPAIIVVDVMSLRIGRQRLRQKLRRLAGELPIIWITEMSNGMEESGPADFYLTRPFLAEELITQIRSLTELRAGDLVFHVLERTVYRGGRAVRLTPKQARLLETFMRHPGEVLSRRFLMKHVWNTDYLGDTRTLDVHIRWVRQAIEENPSRPVLLRTVRGVGYRFEVPPASEEEALEAPSALEEIGPPPAMMEGLLPES